jgi:two-component system, OmpR family, aerobic respiration control sensor histidine kinase ArcB
MSFSSQNTKKSLQDGTNVLMVLENIEQPFVILSPNGHILWTNHNAMNVFPQLVTYAPFNKFFRSLSLEEVISSALKIKVESGGARWEWQKQHIQLDAEKIILLSGKMVSSVDELKEQLHQVNSILQKVPGFVFWKDTSSVYKWCNESFSRNAGLNNPDEIVGLTDYDLPWKNHESDRYVRDDKEVMGIGKAKLNIEETQHKADGQEIHVLTSKAPLYDQKGEVSGLLSTSVDITEYKQIEKSLARVTVEAQQANDSNNIKKEFLQNMRHDIRTPFSGIISIAQILSRQESNEEKRALLADIEHSADSILGYLNEILEFSLIDSGQVPLADKPFNLYRLSEECINIITPPAREKGLEVQLEYEQGISRIFSGDAFRIKRCLINLLTNAVKFTRLGSVKLKVSLEESHDENVLVHFMVEDTGIGIPMDQCQSVCDDFSKLSSSGHGRYGARGLGLPAVKRLMADLNGKVKIDSDPRTGTKFCCIVPMRLT